jgi:hypothetical protein
LSKASKKAETTAMSSMPPNYLVSKIHLKPAMKAQTEVEVQLYPLFNYHANWKWVVNATPWLLYHGK